MKKSPRIAIVYDRVNKFGGAERVLIVLKKIYPDAVLFTSVFDPKGADWARSWDVRTTFLQHVPFAKNHHEWFAAFMPLAFDTLDFSEFDIVISITSEFAKNIVTKSAQLHICYCLTPVRYLWSHTHEYKKGAFSFLREIAFYKLRLVDQLAAQRPDVYIAISERVAARIKKYYRRQVDFVVYPPSGLVIPAKAGIQTKKISQHSAWIPDKAPNRRLYRDDVGYYLVVSRLVPYKKVDIAISACIKMKRHLFVVGEGSDFSRLESIGNGSEYIHFLGKVEEGELIRLYRNASALLCPQEEDFGLVSIEAQGHGTPVISYVHSGVAETLIDGKSGILFTSQTIDSLCMAIKRFEKIKWNGKVIMKHAKRFEEQRFVKAFSQTINKLWKEKRVK